MLLYPKSREEWLAIRHNYVSSTDVADLYDVGYRTRLQLWYEKSQDAPTITEATERQEFGLANQKAIATYIARKYGLRVRAKNAFAALDESRMGASFDYEIIAEDPQITDVEDDSLQQMYRTKGPGLLEIKTVDWMIFRDEWTKLDGGGLQPPAHIELQLQAQLHCVKFDWGVIGVVVGGNRLELFIRARDEWVGTKIEGRIRIFWQWVENDQQPPERIPDDVEVLKKIYGHADPQSVFDGTGKPELTRLFKTYRVAAENEKKYHQSKQLAQIEIYKLVGDASKAFDDEFTLACGLVPPTRIEAYDREGYRMFQLRPKKKTKPPEATAAAVAQEAGK